ncbi:hypothetical protein HYC85_027274 [Camellia sinensis]|uniref:Serine aminopeptidase S33 domain-containing protein n=1 Tax=Camellia sinensis TaxID=4442 RepID=A0A7J7G786_CAMSI|nr:hypothetical protein HYC85_027274 [Camellia sinensis]
MAAVEMEELTSGASGRIIPVFKNLRRSVFSYDSFRRSLIFIQSIFLWFLLLLPRQRLSSASQPPSPSSSWPVTEAEVRNQERGRGYSAASSPCGGGIMVIIHGLNEHSGRYAHFARQLTSCNFGVYAMDWIGHGGSDGLHGYVPSLDHVVADTGAFLEKIKSEYPGIPCFLFGHSTGGAVVLKAASYPQIEQMLEGIILTSPALRVKPAHPLVGAVAPLFSMVVPKYQFKGANKRGIPVSRDPAALLAKYSDPLVYTGPMRVRTGHEILRISSYLLRNLKSMTIPFFVLHGTADKVTDPLASQDLYNRAASEFKDIKLYEGFLHDLLFEPEHDEVAQDIIDWMEKRLLTSCNLENVNSQW